MPDETKKYEGTYLDGLKQNAKALEESIVSRKKLNRADLELGTKGEEQTLAQINTEIAKLEKNG